MMHTPCRGMEVLTRENYPLWLFDALPDVDKFCEEHVRYGERCGGMGSRCCSWRIRCRSSAR